MVVSQHFLMHQVTCLQCHYPLHILCYYMALRYGLSARPLPPASTASSPTSSLKRCSWFNLLSNEELHQRTDHPSIFCTITQCHVCWVGHILQQPFYRNSSRTHIHWKDIVFKDIQHINLALKAVLMLCHNFYGLKVGR